MRISDKEEKIRRSNRMRERRERFIAEHRCSVCGKQDERTLSGSRMCADCAEKERKRKEAKTPAVTFPQNTPDGRPFGVLISSYLDIDKDPTNKK